MLYFCYGGNVLIRPVSGEILIFYVCTYRFSSYAVPRGADSRTFSLRKAKPHLEVCVVLKMYGMPDNITA